MDIHNTSLFAAKTTAIVMAGLGPGHPRFTAAGRKKDVDARAKPGHDVERLVLDCPNAFICRQP
jgi:hypothetical protein